MKMTPGLLRDLASKYSVPYQTVMYLTRILGEDGDYDDLIRALKNYEEMISNIEKVFSIGKNREDNYLERYDLLCKEVQHQITFIGDFFEFDFEHLQQVLNEMKKIQDILKGDIK